MANVLYSTSKDELEMVLCFLDFHDIHAGPTNMQNSVIDLQQSKHEAQSKLLNTGNLRSDCDGKKSLMPGDALIC